MELASSRPRQKTERGIERIAEHFDRCVDVPEIIWIVDRRAPSVAAAAKAVAVTGGRPRTGGEILAAEQRRCRPYGVDTAEAIVRGEFGIAAGEQRADAQMVRRVIRDASGEEIAAREAERGAGLDIERGDAPFSGASQDFHAAVDRDDAPFDQTDC